MKAERSYKTKNFFITTTFKTISIFEGSLVLTAVYIWLCGDRSHSSSLCWWTLSFASPVTARKTLQEEEKDPVSLSSQRSGSVGFPRNKTMVLENFSWKVSCSRKYPYQPTLCLSSPLTPPGLSVTTCCCHSPWTICCAHCHMWDLGTAPAAPVMDKHPVILACSTIISWEMDLL